MKEKPGPPLHVVLVEPQIPPNTGNIARLCAGMNVKLILVGELGFELSDASLKRAGLDYWEFVSWVHHQNKEEFFNSLPSSSFHLLTTHTTRPYTEIPVTTGDYLIFGKETAGLPKSLLKQYEKQCYTIPMVEKGVRSLNLSTAVGVVLYDALRRLTPF